MPTLDISGTFLGIGRPKAIVPIMEADAKTLSEKACEAVKAGADIIEWRVDYFRDLSPVSLKDAGAKLKDATSVPIIATLRTVSQGGRADVTDDSYEGIVGTLIESAPDLVDIEGTCGDYRTHKLVGYAHKHGVRALISHHDFTATPAIPEMIRLLCSMAARGADVAKLAVMATDASDPLRLMEATIRATELVQVPLVTLAMGEAGAITRLAGESFGSAATFCALSKASAPGQIPLGRAIHAMDALHEALAESIGTKES